MTPEAVHGTRQSVTRQVEPKGCAEQSACSDSNPVITRPEEAISPHRVTAQGLKGVLSTVIYYVDGACPNNGKGTGEAYGSWCRVEDGVITDHDTFPLPTARTNNEAEYQSLLVLLDRGCERDSVIRSDSKLIVEQSNGRWKIKERHLRDYCEQVKRLLNSNGKHTLEWVPRGEVESYLGH